MSKLNSVIVGENVKLIENGILYEIEDKVQNSSESYLYLIDDDGSSFTAEENEFELINKVL